MLNKDKTKLAVVVSASLAASAAIGAASAGENPFTLNDLQSGYNLSMFDGHGKDGEGKCGEGKCGEDKAEKAEEGKCGEGKCGEGKCGEDKAEKTEEGKCGGAS